jgi:UPF0716 protein FxsA
MPIFLLLLMLLIGIPLIEIYILIEVGSRIGALSTVGLVIFTAILGAALLRKQGLATLARFQATLQREELPAIELLEGVILLFTGAMLLTPGFFTDMLGFCLLVPSIRQYLVLRVMQSSVIITGRTQQHSDIIDAEFREVPDENKRLP